MEQSTRLACEEGLVVEEIQVRNRAFADAPSKVDEITQVADDAAIGCAYRQDRRLDAALFDLQLWYVSRAGQRLFPTTGFTHDGYCLSFSRTKIE